MLMHLPEELLVEIVQVERGNLKNLCLVNRTLCRIAQPVLFNKIVVRNSRQAQWLIKRLEQNTEISEHCKELTCSDASMAPSLPSLLPKLYRIRDLSIVLNFVASGYQRPSQLTLPARYLDAFTNHTNWNTITTLSIITGLPKPLSKLLATIWASAPHLDVFCLRLLPFAFRTSPKLKDFAALAEDCVGKGTFRSMLITDSDSEDIKNIDYALTWPSKLAHILVSNPYIKPIDLDLSELLAAHKPWLRSIGVAMPMSSFHFDPMGFDRLECLVVETYDQLHLLEHFLHSFGDSLIAAEKLARVVLVMVTQHADSNVQLEDLFYSDFQPALERFVGRMSNENYFMRSFHFVLRNRHWSVSLPGTYMSRRFLFDEDGNITYGQNDIRNLYYDVPKEWFDSFELDTQPVAKPDEYHTHNHPQWNGLHRTTTAP